MHATWEATHTFLILSLNYFVWLYSSAVVDVGRATYTALLIFGAVFIMRAIVYTQLFYIKTSLKPNLLLDRLFAYLHIVMIACLVYAVVRAFAIMQSGNYEANYTFLPLLWPGVILMVPLISVPLYFLYRTKSC